MSKLVEYVRCTSKTHEVHHHPDVECPLCEAEARTQPRTRQQLDGARGGAASAAPRSVARGINPARADVGLLFRGERRTLADWCRRLKIERRTVEWRLANGWTVEEALGTAPSPAARDRLPAQQVGKIGR